MGTRNSINASGTSGLGSESGVITDFGGNKASFNNATAVTLSSTDKMQQYNFHFTYATGGDVYYGYGYHSYSANGSDIYTVNSTITNSSGTYTIDSVYNDTSWGTPNQVSINSYYDADGVGYVAGSGVGFAGLGSEKGFIFKLNSVDALGHGTSLGQFTATSDADLSAFVENASGSPSSNGHYTATLPSTSSNATTGGLGLDSLDFNVNDNASISLTNVTGIELIDLKSANTTTQTLKINFDDVFNSDNKIIMVMGEPNDDSIILSRTSAALGGGAVTWTQNNNAMIYTPDNHYFNVWQGSDSNSATSDVLLLLQQNISVSQVAA